MPLCIPHYDLLEIHKMMLSDSIRTSGYCKAIASLVSEETVVLDLGSGTGLLSIASAMAGAKKTIAIERSKIARVSKKIISDNGLTEQIDVFEQDSTNLELPYKVDVIVSEWMGVHVFQENMLFDFLEIRDKFLNQGGFLIPNKVSLFIAPVISETISKREITPWESPIDGISFKEIARLSMNDVYIDCVRAVNLASKGKCVCELDLYKIQKNQLGKIKMSEEFSFEHPQKINAICGWFNAQLTEKIVLKTGPKDAPTHWKQTIYPVYPVVDVSAGETIVIKIIAEPQNGFTHFTWSVSVKGKDVEREYSTKNNYTLS
jgi:precorrin-6B methylase 2